MQTKALLTDWWAEPHLAEVNVNRRETREEGKHTLCRRVCVRVMVCVSGRVGAFTLLSKYWELLLQLSGIWVTVSHIWMFLLLECFWCVCVCL